MTTYLSLGSNLGDKEQNLNLAIEQIGRLVGEVVKRSSFYYSEPWGFKSDNSFVNICIAVETSLSPLDLLHTTQQIETMLGRKHKSTRRGGKPQYSDRVIDIDILLYGEETIDLPELKIPHPLMQKRDFVMIPLMEIQDK